MQLNKPEIANAQSEFVTALTNAELTAPKDVRQQTKEGQSARFNVYRNNVMVSLVDNLQAAFPAVHSMVGDDFFKAMARVYVDQHPPKSPLMFQYGDDFAKFLATFEPVQQIPFLPDLAAFEHARLIATHAHDAPAIGVESLLKYEQDLIDGVKLTPHPSLHLMQSKFPIASIWSKATNPELDVVVDPTQGECWALVRPDLVVNTHLMPKDGFCFVTHLAPNASIGQALQITLETYPDFDLGQHLGGLFSLGLFIATTL